MLNDEEENIVISKSEMLRYSYCLVFYEYFSCNFSCSLFLERGKIFLLGKYFRFYRFYIFF